MELLSEKAAEMARREQAVIEGQMLRYLARGYDGVDVVCDDPVEMITDGESKFRTSVMVRPWVGDSPETRYHTSYGTQRYRFREDVTLKDVREELEERTM